MFKQNTLFESQLRKYKIYKIVKYNFFKNVKLERFKKEYLLNAYDSITLDNENRISHVYFKLVIQKYKDDLILMIQLQSWSNEAQNYVPLKDSIWSEKGFGDGKYLSPIEEHYKPIIKNFLHGLDDYLKKYWHLKEFIYIIENPLVHYHYKLLNTFTKKELDLINGLFENIPEINICAFHQEETAHKFPYILNVKYCNGFYIDYIEISIDLDETDYATIEYIEHGFQKISKEEALKKLFK